MPCAQRPWGPLHKPAGSGRGCAAPDSSAAPRAGKAFPAPSPAHRPAACPEPCLPAGPAVRSRRALLWGPRGAKSARPSGVPEPLKLQIWKQLGRGRQMKAKRKAGGGVSPGPSVRWPWLCARAAAVPGAPGAPRSRWDTRRDQRHRPRTLLRPPMGSVRGLCALQKRICKQTGRPRREHSGLRQSRPPEPDAVRAVASPGPERRLTFQHDTDLNTRVNLASVLPWKFYRSVVYFFSKCFLELSAELFHI